MTTKQLIEKLQQLPSNMDVMIDFDTFTENENGSILPVDSAEVRNVQGADDSGPVGPRFDMLVLSGERELVNET